MTNSDNFGSIVTRPRTRARRAAVMLTCLLGVPALGRAQTPVGTPDSTRMVVIQLNGRPFSDGLLVLTESQEEVVVPVVDLARAIDGPTAVPSGGGGGSSSRLRLDGNRLIAARAGGCSGCPVQVSRLVVISSRVRAVNGTVTLPLADLVAAFEGRLEVDSTRTRYGIHAGKCTWCILEPSR